ncbi:peptidyl-prolyl cis-trans isomerase C [Pseudochelatococcus lubricantis]|uniref:Parvulin-like PPIase n=1 Tax=Pseudochelatococcus lubricantis TaxID=1538102 RepID=A0ABX0V1Y2_9HYPH|nr:peptidylprolyl isomerase [Pseudochelatococcus lubricantis]NIJ58618.1 peptidyl-prolyl cis-trans isomerase C [Pseudochelatococcus lubricantis]
MIARRFRLPALLAASLVAYSGVAVAQQPAASSPASAETQAGDKVLARVNGATITERDLALAAEELSDRLPAMPEAQRRDYLVGYLIDIRLGSAAAQAEKLDESAGFAGRLAYARDKVLVDEYLAKVARDAATDEAGRKLYEETIKNLTPEDEVRARHILVPDEAAAKAVAERLKKGEDFAALATELSKDPGSAKEGGDLGYFTRDRMVPEFSEIAFKLDPGKVSDPVKSQFGWHVIKVEDRRQKPVPTYEEVKDQIETFIVQRAQQEAVLALREKAKIERLDKPAGAEKGDAPASGNGAADAAKPAAPAKK